MIQKKPVFVVHLEDEFKVFSGICTHLGCIVKWEENKNRFYCPCHKGIFDKTGKVTGGPPPRPLDEFTVEMDDNLVFVKVEDKDRSPWS
jgi:Rieske Fe-S protein